MLRHAALFVAWAVLGVAALPALVVVGAVVGLYTLVEVALGAAWLVALFVRHLLGMRSP